MTKTATIKAPAPAGELDDLLTERQALENEIAAAAAARLTLEKEWRSERSRRHITAASFPGQPVDPRIAEYQAADESWRVRIAEQTQAIATANRRKRDLDTRIAAGRTLAREARHSAAAKEGAGDVAALAADVDAARRVQRSVSTELETVNARHAAAMEEGDAAALLELTPRRRELAIEATAARTGLLRAEAAHARAEMAQYAQEAHAAAGAVQKAEAAVQKAQDDLLVAMAPVRNAAAAQDAARRRVRQLEGDLARHLAAQQGSAA